MLRLWLLAVLLPECLGGNLYPVSSGSSVEAHGPLARLALQPHYDHVTSLHHVTPVAASQYAHEAPVYHAPAVTPVAATQYAHEAPVYHASAVTPVAATQYAHEAPVYHVPSVAQVYTSQPRYVQRLVDVSRPQVAVAKLQVKRPAIQKHFYDIEERTIVRPVGSAVLELDEPVSKQFVTPFAVAPAGHHTVAQYHRPLLYPVGSYPLVAYRPLQYPVQYYPPATIQQTPQVPQLYPLLSQVPQQFPVSQPPQQFPSVSQPPQQFPSTPEPPQQFPSVSQPPQQFPSIPQPPSSAPPQQIPSIPQFPQQPSNPQPQPPQEFQFGSQPSPDDSSNTEFDSSDTVVVDNPDFTRSSKPDDEPQKDNGNEESFNEFEREVLDNSRKNEEQERVVQNIINDFENFQLLRMFSSRSGNEKQPLQRSQQGPNFNVLVEPPKIQDQYQDLQKKSLEDKQSIQQRLKENEDSRVSSQTENRIETSSSSESDHRTSSSTTERELPTLYRSYLDHLRDDQNSASKTRVISSARNLSPEESQENQRKLLELLTGRGEVSEVGKSSLVRGRVLSVTPAPCRDGEERVNTRRVVVSRPVHTVEEVDVQRPFTQVERVAVHEPVHEHTHVATLTPLLYH